MDGMAMEHETCKPIQVLDYQIPGDTPRESTNCNAYQTGRKLYDDVSKSVVLVETGETPSPRPPSSAKVGTGFFVNNGDEIVTNGHVGAIDPYVDIFTNDGKHYHAKLEKLDDVNDLALLKVIGIEKDPSRALKTANTSGMQKPDEIETFGRPDGSPQVVLSPGTYITRGALIDQIPDPNSFPDLAKIINWSHDNINPELAKLASSYLSSERIHARMDIHHGDSGSPAVNSGGQLVGVMADRVSAAHALMVPAEKVNELLSSPDNKFNFNYEVDENQNQKLLSITRKDGSTLPPLILK
jgi:S1-C subfamily serine protease